MGTAHLLQRAERRFLVFLQLQSGAVQRLGLLGGQIVFDLLESRVVAQEHTKLILDLFGILLELSNRPAVHIPTQMDHAVLLQ